MAAQHIPHDAVANWSQACARNGPECTRDIPGEVPAAGGSGKAAYTAPDGRWRAIGAWRGISAVRVLKLIEWRILFTPNRDTRRSTFRAPGTLGNFSAVWSVQLRWRPQASRVGTRSPHSYRKCGR